MTEYCSICEVNELSTPDEVNNGVCTECSLTLTDDVISDEPQLL